MFPIMQVYPEDKYPYPIKEIPWTLIAPHENQAQRNHSQTLERLAARGGLSPMEAVAVLEDAKFVQRWPRPANNDFRQMHAEANEILRSMLDNNTDPKAILRELVPTAYALNDCAVIHERIVIEQRRGGADGSESRWAVVRDGLVLNHAGEWEYEPMPSSRTSSFLARCRYNSLEEACQFLSKWLSQQPKESKCQQNESGPPAVPAQNPSPSPVPGQA